MSRTKGAVNKTPKVAYKDEYAVRLIQFFKSYGQKDGETGIPTLNKFAEIIGTSTGRCATWAKTEEKFALAYTEAMRIQERMLINGALTRVFDSNFAKFLLACNHGYREKDEKKADESQNTSLKIVIGRKESGKK